MKNLAIIPARGGSKRIPKKNIKNFLGKPIIAYSIETALESDLFEEVMVSTDDEEIAEVAREYGAEVPFMRSKKNADDYATTTDVVKEVLFDYKNHNRRFKKVSCIYPTAPFINKEILREAHELLEAGNIDAVFPIVEYTYPIQRALKIESGNIEYFFPEYASHRSQDLEKAYKDAGMFYFFYYTNFIKRGRIKGKNTKGIIVNPLSAHDIDEEEDWHIAQMKYKLYK